MTEVEEQPLLSAEPPSEVDEPLKVDQPLLSGTPSDPPVYQDKFCITFSYTKDAYNVVVYSNKI